LCSPPPVAWPIERKSPSLHLNQLYTHHAVRDVSRDGAIYPYFWASVWCNDPFVSEHSLIIYIVITSAV